MVNWVASITIIITTTTTTTTTTPPRTHLPDNKGHASSIEGSKDSSHKVLVEDFITTIKETVTREGRVNFLVGETPRENYPDCPGDTCIFWMYMRKG